MLAALVLKLAYAFVLAVNSDEPQHLHVVWAWTIGELPYRDVFDNHAPLFQMLYAPLLAAVGERTDIVAWMRIAVLPLYCGCLWLTWRIGRQLWSRTVAAAALAIVALLPPFFVMSTEFRPDDLWAFGWLAVVATVGGGRLDARRGALAGLLAGATLSVSLKTLPLLATATFAAVLVAMGVRRGRPWRQCVPWRFIAAFAAASLLVPAALAAWFFENDAGPAMLYALFRHNVVPELGRWEHGDLRFALMPLTLPLALWIAWLRRPAAGEDPAPWARRSFVLLAAAGYLAVLYGYWPLVTQQDLLPTAPFAALALAALLHRAAPAQPGRQRMQFAATLLLLAAEAAVLVAGHPAWRTRYDIYAAQLAHVLQLTDDGDLVMDPKGESIFRHRPTYWVLESITLARMADGSIEDDIAARLAETATPVVNPERLPQRDFAFVARNYLAVGDNLGVAGRRLGPATAGVPLRFDISVPQAYAVVQRDGAVAAAIDGRECVPACRLDAGAHVLTTNRSGETALVWAPSLQRGLDVAALFSDAQRIAPLREYRR